MVRQIVITIPTEYADKIVQPLSKLNIVHHLSVYHGHNTKHGSITRITCKVVNKKTDDILAWCSRYGIATGPNGVGTLDVLALTSTKPRISTFRGIKPKNHRYMISERMSYDEMFDLVDQQIHLTFDYLSLIVTGSVICAAGLLSNSPVAVVASMLVSPLMGPIVGMTFGFIVWDLKMFWTSFRNELLGLLVCWLSGAIMGLAVGTLYNVDNPKGPMGDNTEMSSRGQVEALYWGSIIAFASGIGVALGTSSYQISALIGVAISAALLPPIVNSGVCLGASLIMFLRPNQSDHMIIHTWVTTGIISMALFLINWVLLFISAIIMLRFKNLHLFANASKTDENYTKFNKLVSDVQTHVYGGGSGNMLKSYDKSLKSFTSTGSGFANASISSDQIITPSTRISSKSTDNMKNNNKNIKYRQKIVSQTPKFEPNVNNDINNTSNNNNINDPTFDFNIEINNSQAKVKNFELTPSKQAINSNNKQIYGSVLSADKIKSPNNNDIMREPLLQKTINETKTWTDDMNINSTSKTLNKSLSSIKQRRNSEL